MRTSLCTCGHRPFVLFFKNTQLSDFCTAEKFPLIVIGRKASQIFTSDTDNRNQNLFYLWVPLGKSFASVSPLNESSTLCTTPYMQSNEYFEADLGG